MGGTNGEELSKVLEIGPLSLKEKKNQIDVVLMLQLARLEEAWR